MCFLVFLSQSKDAKYFIHNHLSFVVNYHKDQKTDLARIVGFEVKPFRYIYLCSYGKFNSFYRNFLLFMIPLKLLFYSILFASIKHEYAEWNGQKTHLTTCDPQAKHYVVNSDVPQEVEGKKEIVFTYDVEFKVRYFVSSSNV